VDFRDWGDEKVRADLQVMGQTLQSSAICRDGFELLIRFEGWVQRVPLGREPLVFGRAPECDVHVLEQSLSRQHCRILPEGDGWVVEDLGSRAGTLLDGIPVERPTPLRPGDRLQVGRLDVRVLPRLSESSVLSGDPGRDSRNIDLVLRTISDLYASSSLDELLCTIVDRTMLLAGADRGALLLAGEGEQLEAVVTRGLDGRKQPPEQFLSRSLPSRALKTGRAVVLTDSEAPEQRRTVTESVALGQLRSVLCVPLPGQHGPLGVLYADGQRPAEDFGPGELAIFEALAAHGALAIERARLREEQARRDGEARRRLEAENAALKVRLGANLPIGESEPMQQVLEMIRRIASSSATVCLLGETGTGKEVLARYLHRLSPRASGPFVVIDCGALPENLIEAELFGHRKGAFTGAAEAHSGLFQAAQGGTILLDEIGDLPLGVQSRLLRVLQEHTVLPVGETQRVPVDVRIVCATHRNLARRVAEGQFREDLFYRISVLTLQIPTLRERGDDVLLLAHHFLDRAAAAQGSAISGLAPSAAAALLAHSWPGNVRELENRIQRAVLLARPPYMTRQDLGLDVPRPPEPWAPVERNGNVLPLQDARAEVNESFERAYVQELLLRTGGNVSQAAALAGVSKQLLRRLLRRHGIDRREFLGGGA
jgi:transcriptional regulator with GAF, ATPase, and Fis domain